MAHDVAHFAYDSPDLENDRHCRHVRDLGRRSRRPGGTRLAGVAGRPGDAARPPTGPGPRGTTRSAPPLKYMKKVLTVLGGGAGRRGVPGGATTR
jgi:hypothetical protein